jgi:DNA-binding response OmpR family regulator
MERAEMKPKVLAVDDDAEFTELISYNLRRDGCEVLTAATGVQGLDLARTQLPDVILLDLMLPDLDGHSVFQILRAQPSTKSIPILIVSALGETWTERRVARQRCAGYFQKPIDLKALTQSVHAAAREHETMLTAALNRPENYPPG